MWRKIGFQENIRRLEAKRTRFHLQFSDTRLTPDQIYDLVLAETDNRNMAEKAMQKILWARLKAGEKT